MIKQDADDFKLMLESTMSIYSAECNVNVLRIWWSALSNNDFTVVKEAFSRHIQDSKNGRFAPKPADIIGIIESLTSDQRLGADEAWALYPHNEQSSAVITDEMAEAMGVAQPLINEGDKIAARMAFKEAYIRIVTRNKLAGINPKWFASLGHDAECREVALKEAVLLGRIANDHAENLLPVKYDTKVIDAIENIQLLTVNKMTDEERKIAHEKMKSIKLMLKSEIENG